MSDNMKTYRQALRDLPASRDGKDATLRGVRDLGENVE